VIWPLLFFISNAFSYDCHFDYSVWNTILKRSAPPVAVRKFRKDLSKDEIGPFGCTICREDQIRIKLSNSLEFNACHKVASRFKEALEKALDQGAQIEKILGYRPSKSRGKADARGFRTEFSSHAFGVGLDINDFQNGLYTNCLTWKTSCVLIKGGHYRPFKDQRSLTPKSPLVREMIKQGLKWGGNITGIQKDFMHFSPDGL
jgi:hypothetical protein